MKIVKEMMENGTLYIGPRYTREETIQNTIAYLERKDVKAQLIAQWSCGRDYEKIVSDLKKTLEEI